jgi:hypothetical protein
LFHGPRAPRRKSSLDQDFDRTGGEEQEQRPHADPVQRGADDQRETEHDTVTIESRMLTSSGTQPADVTVTGPAQSLLLIPTRRLPLTDREATAISVDGDTDLARHWLDNTAHVSG